VFDSGMRMVFVLSRRIFAQCDVANPNGPQGGTCFFGGPAATGPVNGLQSEYARIPYATTMLVKVPDAVSDDQAIMVSDVLPTGWFGAHLAKVRAGNTVLVLGAGVVGQCAIASAKLQGASRVLVVDGLDDRLGIARAQNAEIINFNEEDPVKAVRDLTGGIGVDRVIDAVGIDAQRPAKGPALENLPVDVGVLEEERRAAAPEGNVGGGQWVVGDAPSLAARWAIGAVAKAGTLGVIGVYPPNFDRFPFGEAMNRNLTIQSGNCNHRRYVPGLLYRVARGDVDPTRFGPSSRVSPTLFGAVGGAVHRRGDHVPVCLLGCATGMRGLRCRAARERGHRGAAVGAVCTRRSSTRRAADRAMAGFR
jgi:threonine dehydrogenase-like Zn-dependent dehydrogenase